MHCISKYVVDYCVLHNIDTLVIGHSKKWKQENKRQQGFSYIPYEMFIKMLTYKCENKGIKYIEVEEQYTSGTSFLAFSWKYLSLLPHAIAGNEPMPLYTLKLLPW